MTAQAPELVGTKRRHVTGRRSLGRLASWILFCLLALVCLYPIVFVLFSAFRPPVSYEKDSVAIPTRPEVSNFQHAWAVANIGSTVVHSIIVVVSAVVILAVVATLAGYTLVHMHIKFRRAWLFIFVGMMMMPSSVLMVPLFDLVKDFGLLNHFMGLILVYCSLQLPFSIYLMSAYFQRIPTDIMEASEIDGAGPLRALQTIGVPLVLPGILTMCTLNFLWLWNELLYGLLILQEQGKRTLMTGIALLNGEHTTGVPLISAGLLIAMVPPVLLFALLQRNLVQGITAGSGR